MVSTDATIDKTPRCFWRRLFAYAIDACIAWLIAVALLALIEDDIVGSDLISPKVTYDFAIAFNSSEFKPPVTFGTKTCGRPTSLLGLEEQFAPATISWIEVCIERPYGMPVGGTAKVVLEDTPEASELGSRTFYVPLRIHTLHRFGDVMAFGIFLCMSILTTRLFGQSPGKRLLGIKVVGRSPVPSLRREMIRNLPHLLVVPTFALINWLVLPLPAVPGVVQTLAIGLEILSAVAFIFLWLVPMVRWRGALPHDRWFGTKVVRVDGNRTGGHGDIGSCRPTRFPSETFTGLAPSMAGRPLV
jgi:uncharacterized RDD family membrane protein YckC